MAMPVARLQPRTATALALAHLGWRRGQWPMVACPAASRRWSPPQHRPSPAQRGKKQTHNDTLRLTGALRQGIHQTVRMHAAQSQVNTTTAPAHTSGRCTRNTTRALQQLKSSMSDAHCHCRPRSARALTCLLPLPLVLLVRLP
jgi:hypothetical protein